MHSGLSLTSSRMEELALFIQFSRHFGGDREYFSGSACRQGEEEESEEENRELDCFLNPCMGSGTGRRGQH